MMMSPRSFLVSRQKNQIERSSRQNHNPLLPPTAATLSRRRDDHKPRHVAESSSKSSSTSSSNITSIETVPDAMVFKRKSSTLAASPPKSATTLTRPTTPTSPVQIPKSKRDSAHAHTVKHHPHGRHNRHEEQRDRTRSPSRRSERSPDAIPASVAALLAATSIPRPKSERSLRSRSGRGKRVAAESILKQAHELEHLEQESEKDLGSEFGKSPLDMLLTPPEELEGDDISIADSTLESFPFTRTVSLESMPSLGSSFTTETLSSVESPLTPARGRKVHPTRRSLEPVSSPPAGGELEDHPLSRPAIDVEELDFRVFEESEDTDTKKIEVPKPLRTPLKSAFKSNLTASLRALRNAALSFSSLNLTSIPPEDFLTRSILTIDPPVPFTDERRPPDLEEEPSAEMRRYFNPTQTARLEGRSPSAPPALSRTGFTASIQMRTYKVQRSKSTSPSALTRFPRRLSAGSSQGDLSGMQKDDPYALPLPGPRQREMRENSDFIRIAVMEMAMRKRGKLDDQRPGRARWALPPRKVSSKPYDIGDDGIPARWVAVTY